MANEKLYTPLLISLMILSFVLAMSEFIVIGILPDISKDIGTTIAMVGIVVSVYAIAYAIGTPIVTWAVSRYSEFKMILLLLGLFALSNLLTMISTEYYLLLVSRIMTAAVSGTIMSIAIVVAMKNSPQQYSNKVVTLMFVGFSVASVFGMPLGITISQVIGWRYVFALVLAMTLVLFILLLILLPKKGSEYTEYNQKDTFDLLKDRRIILGICIAAFSVAGIFTFYTYVTPILEDIMGFEASAVGAIFLAYGLACVFGNFLSAKFADKGGFRFFPIVFLIEIALLLVLIPIAGVSAYISVGLLLLIGLFIYLVNTTNQVHFIEIAIQKYPSATNFASSMNMVAFNIGIAVGSFIGSICIGSFGLESLGYAGAIFVVLALISVLILNVIEKKPEMRTSVSSSRNE